MTTIPSLYVIQIDATQANARNIPTDAIAVAGYVTGTPGIQWSQADWDRFRLAGKMRIDQAPGLAVFAAGYADAADVEAGAATLDEFLAAARRRAEGRHSTLYQSWGANGMALAIARGAVRANGLAELVRYWVAEYSWSAAEAMAFMDSNPDVIAVQFATPSSNPATILPGSTLTLAEAQCDLSVKRADWFGSAAIIATGWQE
jgi:hypothetical protein